MIFLKKYNKLMVSIVAISFNFSGSYFRPHLVLSDLPIKGKPLPVFNQLTAL